VSPDIEATARSIARVQLPCGAIPHWKGHHADPWNHVEAAMGLDVAGLHAQAARAYLWLASIQRSDGAWAAAYKGHEPVDRTLDANFCAYIATGTLHHFAITEDHAFLDRMWPAVEKAVEFALGLQTSSGHILWARDEAYATWPGALLTSCAAIHLSLRSAVILAEQVEEERPDWELALEVLRDAIVSADGFEPKDRFSMDWYYPVLGGVIRGQAARDRLQERWSEFVIEGGGCRCVSDRPWVTAGETAELALALEVAGLSEEALTMFEWLQRLRADDGAYWMGATYPDETIWPRQRPTWGSGAAILAAAALQGDSPTRRLFRDEVLAGAGEPL
jgi:hypothetical protein